MSTMLVDNEQPRLNGGHHIATFILVMGGRFVFNHSTDSSFFLLISIGEKPQIGFFTTLQARIEIFPSAIILALQGCLWCVVEGIIMRIVVHLRCRSVFVGIVYGDVGSSFGIEIDSGHIVKQPHCLAYRCRKNLPHGLFVLEFYFGLRGMDVHIDVFGVHFKVDEVRNLLALWNQTLER